MGGVSTISGTLANESGTSPQSGETSNIGKVAIVEDGSAETFGKIFDVEADGGANTQVGAYGEQENKSLTNSVQPENELSKLVLEDSFVTADYLQENKNIFIGKTAEEIALELNSLGYETTIRKSNREGSSAVVIVVTNSSQNDSRNITQVQVSPGGRRHGAQPYVKVSTSTEGKIKIVQGSRKNYHTDGHETAIIIFTED